MRPPRTHERGRVLTHLPRGDLPQWTACPASVTAPATPAKQLTPPRHRAPFHSCEKLLAPAMVARQPRVINPTARQFREGECQRTTVWIGVRGLKRSGWHKGRRCRVLGPRVGKKKHDACGRLTWRFAWLVLAVGQPLQTGFSLKWPVVVCSASQQASAGLRPHTRSAPQSPHTGGQRNPSVMPCR